MLCENIAVLCTEEEMDKGGDEIEQINGEICLPKKKNIS